MTRPLTLIMFALCFVACEADDPCDEGQTYRQGTCMPSASPDAGAPDANTGGPDASDDASAADSDAGTECSEDQAESLGRSCTDDGACDCAAPYCARMPGQPTGTCTVYCRPNADDCPEGYRCFDLSALGVAGVEPFCIPG